MKFRTTSCCGAKFSARRLNAEGFAATALRYAANDLAEVIAKRPLTTEYPDIR